MAKEIKPKSAGTSKEKISFVCPKCSKSIDVPFQTRGNWLAFEPELICPKCKKDISKSFFASLMLDGKKYKKKRKKEVDNNFTLELDTSAVEKSEDERLEKRISIKAESVPPAVSTGLIDGQKELDPFATCPNYQVLPMKHRMVLLEYLKDFNATQAYRRVYQCSDKSANAQGPLLVNNSNFQKALCEVSVILERGEVADIEELRAYWTRLKRGKITDIMRWNEDGFAFSKSSDEMDPAVASLIKKIKIKEKTSAAGDFTEVQTEIEMHDGLKASEYLGKAHGIFKEKVLHEHTVETFEQRMKRIKGQTEE